MWDFLLLWSPNYIFLFFINPFYYIFHLYCSYFLFYSHPPVNYPSSLLYTCVILGILSLTLLLEWFVCFRDLGTFLLLYFFNLGFHILYTPFLHIILFLLLFDYVACLSGFPLLIFMSLYCFLLVY